MRSLLNFASLDHTCGHKNSANGAILINDFDALEIRFDDAQGLTNDLGTGTTLAADHTASFIFTA